MSKSDSDGNANDNVQMNFLATPEQRERWEEYADENGFRNLSGLFRFAIEQEVGGHSGGGGVPEELTQQVSEIIGGLNRIESRIQDLDGRVQRVEQEVRDDPDLRQLANDIFSVLPTREELVDYAKTSAKSGATPEPASRAGKIEGIAATLDVDEYRVSEALDKLQEEYTTQVHSIMLAEEIQGWDEMGGEHGEEPRYYKEA